MGVGQRDSSRTGGSRTAPTGMTGARAQRSVWNATWGAVRDDMWGAGMRDGFPPPSLRGQALRGNDGGGWVPASARTTGGGAGMRDGFPPPSLREQALRGNDGGGWVPASARTTGGGGGMRDGFPPPSLRGQALRGNDGGGWVPASARTTGGGAGMRDGFPPPSSRGQALRGNDGGGQLAHFSDTPNQRVNSNAILPILMARRPLPQSPLYRRNSKNVHYDNPSHRVVIGETGCSGLDTLPSPSC